MTFNITDTIRDGIDRVTTQAGAVLIVGLAFFATIRAAAAQDIYSGIIETILDELQAADFRDDLGPNQLSTLESIETELEAAIADLPLALGLSPSVATILWLVAYVLGLAVVIIALDTFGHGRDTLSGLETENVGWKVLNLFLGMVVFGILFMIGLVLLVVPGLLVLIFLLFFPAAIVLDNESFFSAYSSSASVVRQNFLATIGLIIAAIILFVVIGIVGSIVSGLLSGASSAVVDEIFSAIAMALGLALIACAYMNGTNATETNATESE